MNALPSAKPQLPGDLALWFFILAELLVFGVFFAAYAVARALDVELFNHYQQTLNRNIGAINTVVLITGSLFVVLAVRAIQHNHSQLCRNWLLAATATGGVFVVLKSLEFSDKFAHGVSLSSNTFYMFYLSLTFFHFLHVILGMIVLGIVAWKTQQNSYSAQNHTDIESAGAYWHMVDLVWIVLFPLVYVIR